MESLHFLFVPTYCSANDDGRFRVVSDNMFIAEKTRFCGILKYV